MAAQQEAAKDYQPNLEVGNCHCCDLIPSLLVEMSDPSLPGDISERRISTDCGSRVLL
jgi:hypothetical protein